MGNVRFRRFQPFHFVANDICGRMRGQVGDATAAESSGSRAMKVLLLSVLLVVVAGCPSVAEVGDDPSGQIADAPSEQGINEWCHNTPGDPSLLPSGVSRADARSTCFEWSNMTDDRFERLFNSAQGIHDDGCTVGAYGSLIRCTSITGGEAWEMACAACFRDIAAAVWN